MDNPEGQVTYPDKQDGRATYRLWHASLHTLRFYLCFLLNQAKWPDQQIFSKATVCSFMEIFPT